MAGTFTRPPHGGPFAAVVLISGSGPSDRDDMPGPSEHRPFLVLSDHLTRRGIAVVRFDDRGVGESTGDHASATSADFASDALAGAAYLQRRKDVDPGAIGLAGASEGGLIAPIAAVRSEDVAFVVLMAGPGVMGERVFLAQDSLLMRGSGAGDEEIVESAALLRAVYGVLKAEPDVDRAGPALAGIFRAHYETMTEAERAEAGVSSEGMLAQVVDGQVAAVNTPWLRYFLTHDPAAVLEQVTVPVLAINGEMDLFVPHEENLRAIEAALVRGGNADYEVRSLPGLNHAFQHAETGMPSEYVEIEETWSEEAMAMISDWVLRVTGRERSSIQ